MLKDQSHVALVACTDAVHLKIVETHFALIN